MARKSARLIGQQIGISSQEVYRRLESIGLVKKATFIFKRSGVNSWELTEEGEKYGNMSDNFPGPIFDDEIIELIKDL